MDTNNNMLAINLIVLSIAFATNSVLLFLILLMTFIISVVFGHIEAAYKSEIHWIDTTDWNNIESRKLMSKYFDLP